MIYDELKHIIETTDGNTFPKALVSWYGAKVRLCKNDKIYAKNCAQELCDMLNYDYSISTNKIENA